LAGGKGFKEKELKGSLFLQMLQKIWGLFYSEPTNIASLCSHDAIRRKNKISIL
jgi:hypothetical protein